MAVLCCSRHDGHCRNTSPHDGSKLIEFQLNGAILFLVGGIAKLFWVVPIIRRWERPWYAAGIGGTAVFIAIWVITRMEDNPITGRGLNVNEMRIAVEVLEAAFTGRAAAVLATG